MNDEEAIQRVATNANQLRASLEKQNFANNIVFKDEAPIKNPNGLDGFLVSIADIDSDLAICASLDRGRDGQFMYWVGFYSKYREPIMALQEIAPLKFDPVNLSNEYEKIGPHYYIKDSAGFEPEIPTYVVDYFECASDFGICFPLNGEFNLTDSLKFIMSMILLIPKFEVYSCGEIETERRQMIDARRGQGKFREALDGLWDGKCAVLEVSTRELLRASHIKPWQECDRKERLDPHNGILLSAHLDALFDKFLISFEDDGKMLVADKIKVTSKILDLGEKRVQKPFRAESYSFLHWHRERFTAKNT